MRARTFEIARGVHWLPMRGANAYLVDSGGSWVLIDAGYAGSAATIREVVGRLCGGGRPRSILLTHGHPDHAGAAMCLAADWDVPILLPEGEVRFVNGTSLYPEPLVFWLARLLPRRAMEALARGSDLGGDVRPFDPQAGAPGMPDWTVVATPGHTPGHVALFRPGDRTLLTGDAVLTLAWHSRLGSRGIGWLWDLARCRPRLCGPPTVVTCDWRAAAASIATLADLEPWVLASGHGVPLAGRHVAPALRELASRVAPPLAGD